MARRPQNQTRRRRVPLRNFAPGCTADPELAWNDRIKLDFRSGAVHVADGGNLYRYLRSLRAGGSITSPARDPSNTSIKFQLREEVPLLGASFKFWRTNRRTATGTGLSSIWNMHVTLEVNPTRMLASCECRQTRLRALRRGIFPTFDEARDRMIRDETLDNGNNYFCDADTRLAVNADAQTINEYAIRASLAFIERVLEPRRSLEPTDEGRAEASWDGTASRDIEFQFDWDHWAISQMETYWEFGTPDAVSTVHALARHASEIASGLEETFYTMDGIHVGSARTRRPENAVSLTIPLGQKHTKLVIYAKAPRRVRCEVRHLKNPRSIYGRYDAVHQLTNGRLENLFLLISEVNRLSGSNRANPFLRELWRRDNRRNGTVVQLTVFLGHVATVCEQTGADMVRVLSPLVANGRLAGSGPESYRSAVRQLVDCGVLRPTNIRRRSTGRDYAVTRPYADVLDQLKNNMRRI